MKLMYPFKKPALAKNNAVITLIVTAVLVFITLTLSLPLLLRPTNSPSLPPTAVKVSSYQFTPSDWRYMPGAIPQNSGVLIQPTDFRIVEQDGSGGQSNPPLNLYGPHVFTEGQWAVTVQMTHVIGNASFQIYNSVPVIADEFRIEPASIRLTLSGNSLRIATWDGSYQANLAQPRPIFDQTYVATATSKVILRITKQNSKLIITDNDTLIAQLPADQIFKTPALWFGAASSSGGYLLDNVTVTAPPSASLSIIKPSQQPVVPLSKNGLQSLAQAKRPGFSVGAAVALGPMVSDSPYAQELFSNFGLITPENAMKWQFIEPQPDLYTFQEADALVLLAQQHHQEVHGHTLLFSEANPQWVQTLPSSTDGDKAAVRQVMVDHITTIVKHFKGRVASWDVVDEPLADYGTFDANSGAIYHQNKWYEGLGAQYIPIAFAAAHAADPQAKLYLNDYGLEEDGERWNAFLSLVKQLQSEGVPIDGVGFEAHVYDSADSINPSVLKKHIDELAALGLQSRISEMDVYDNDGVDVQAKQYSDVFLMCLQDKNCESFTTWGVDDSYDVFQDDSHQLQHGQDLFFSGYKPTEAYQAIISDLQ